MKLPEPKKFRRGTGPLVSVLLPTRKRPESLVASIESIVNNMKDPIRIEFLLKVDDDDLATIQVCSSLSAKIPNFHFEVSPRGAGYGDMHLWLNRLVVKATGDWVLLWNDDARMLTKYWDEGLVNATYTLGPLSLYDFSDVFAYAIHIANKQSSSQPNQAGDLEFALYRKKIFDILGYFSLAPQTNNWLWYALTSAGVEIHWCPVRVHHLVHDNPVQDITYREREIVYWSETVGGKRDLLYSREAWKSRLEAARKLIDWSEKSYAGEV
ncbi:MAG: glycosyltransferase [Patescibacteria group bacterium]|nr:glycosyltransferase [Patescibacteria group bacterium]